MKSLFLAGLVAAVATISHPNCASAQAQPKWAVPAGLPEFGHRDGSNVRVTIFGQVNRPGIYYLPKDVLVRDALESAAGLKELFAPSMSQIYRENAEGMTEIVRFSGGMKKFEETLLKEGDRLYLGYEVY